jgi:hypothetical protein
MSAITRTYLNAPTAPPPDAALSELLSLLNQETDAYCQVEEKLLAKKKILIQGDLDQLTRVDLDLVSLGQLTANLEQQRLEWMAAMGCGHQTLLALCQQLEPHQARPLLEARGRLTRVLERVQVLSRQNQSLLNLSMKWIQQTVKSIVQLVTPEATSYSANGEKGKSAQGQPDASLLGQSTISHSA